MKPVRYSYGITSALLLGGATATLVTGYPAGAQVAQNDDSAIARVVPRAGAPESFADLTQQLQPAVVNISTKQRIQVSSNPFAGTPFADLFGSPGQPTTREAQSLGSGFIISADGYVVTNNHVITADGRGQVQEITVTMPDGTEYPANLVGSDPESDLAVLKIQSDRRFPYVEFGDSSQARVGEWVIAIGNPFGLGGTVTSGIISAVHRSTQAGGAYDRYIQTDASINRGNSGGPLFDMQGNVTGINTALFSPSGGRVGIGYAIPSETAQPIVRKLIAGEEILRGYLGVQINPVSEDFADALGIPENRGEFIQRVERGEAAERAGLQAGDVVLTVDGKAVTPEQTLSFIIANIAPGTTVPVEYLRDGERHTARVTVGRRPSAEQLAQQQFNLNEEEGSNEPILPSASGLIEQRLGLQVTALTPVIARQLGLGEGVTGVVVANVDPNADAARKGLTRGTVIYSAQYQDVATPAQLEAVVRSAVAENREAILLRIQPRGGPAITVPVRLRN